MRRATALPLLAILTTTLAAVPADADELATVSFAVTGPKETVFDYATDRCATNDLPDAAARAFRDASGDVHLIATHYQHWASIGTSLNTAERDCAHMIYAAGANPNPATYDNRGWLETFWTEDGDTIHGLVAMDYHPEHYGLTCATSGDCWYGTTVQATSTDGGYSFTSPAQGTPRFVAGPPYQFDPALPETLGTFVPSNIVVGPDPDYLYATLSFERRAPATDGTCLIRTPREQIGEPTAWRAWGGSGFTVKFASPYPSEPEIPQAHECVSVANSLGRPIRSLLKVEGQDLYLAIAHGTATVGGVTRAVVRASTSTDLITWTPPQTVMELPRYGQFGETCSTHSGQERYQYPSLLDPESTSINFETTGSTAYVYATAITYCAGLDRDLVRWPISITVS